LHFYSWVTSLLFDNMFPEFTLFSSLFYRFLIRNWGFSRQVLSTGENTYVGNTQLQKGSRRSGQEPEEEERNFQKTSEALVDWKEKQRNAKQSNSNPSSQIHANHNESQVNLGQLKASLMNVEQRDDTLLTEFTSKLDKETQKFPLKPVDQKGISEQTKERLSEAGLLKDGLADVKKVAEQEDTGTNQAIDKNSDLSKILEKDAAQLKVGVIEEEREGTSAEHTDSYDRNRVALGNRNKRPLNWAKQVADSQQKKDTKKGISI
ncbi:MAG: hypothetical protein ACR5LA_12390, partial [Wolbachia sp.]